MSNKAFTKYSRIQLDESYVLESDGDSGIVLIFSEPRQKEITKKENGKVIKTGEFEDFIFEDRWYFTRIVQSLKKYTELTLNSSKTLQEIIEKEDKIYDILNDINNEFRQFK
jgi:hypothetical protein